MCIVGQDPGADEVAEDKPFVEYAPSGRMLMAALKLAGTKRENVYLTNARKCLPPKDATAKESEEALAHCAQYLDAEMADITPNVILTLGAPALLRVTGRRELLKKWAGTVFKSTEVGEQYVFGESEEPSY